MNAVAAIDSRVLVLAPTVKDYELLQDIFERHSIQGLSCPNLETACGELALGAGALLVAEESLVVNGPLTKWLHQQAPWSDLPILVLARPGAEYSAAAAATNHLGNVTILDRPTRVATLVSAVQSALRARNRQYQIRDHLDEQQQSQAQLRANDQRKDEFLAILAHELRNPLAPISNGLQLLNLAYRDDTKTAAIRQMMERQLGNMKRLVDDLLEASRVTRGELELRLERAELAAIIKSAIEVSQPLIAAARHRLEVSLPPQPVYLQADVVRLAQVISNLLHNAAKYTRGSGLIKLSVDSTDQEVIITIEDNGVGIPPELQPRIFDMFMQVDVSRNRAQGGLGIGLTLVKRLVELHGGTVEVFSEGLGEGSRFTVRLPIRNGGEVSGTRLLPVIEQDLSSLNVLIADDNRDAADTLGHLLRNLGASVHVTYGGAEAVATFERTQADVAILDIGMQDLDGMKVARRIRAQHGLDILLIALTGWGQQQDILETRQAGFNHHLTKPVDIPQLLTLLNGARVAH